MEVFVLHILKLNVIAATVILLVKVLAALLKGKVSARWKYFIWLFVTVSLMIPVQLPSNLSLVDFKVIKSSQPDVQNLKTQESAAVNNMKRQTEIPEQKELDVCEAGKWMGIAAVIFVAVWLSVAVLKLAGELLAYSFSMKNLERMSLQVSDPVSIQMYRAACERKHVRKIPELRQNAGLTTPLLAGLFHTRLYLPAAGYSAEERKLVFYHELTHYCHRDLWYKMLLRICASIYWFNPFLLIMLKEADKDIENLCDTAVVSKVSQKDHRLYRQLLLRTVAMDNQVPYVTASLNDSGMVFKDRILYMLNIRKFRTGILPGILMVLLLVGGNLAFNISATLAEAVAPAVEEKNGQPQKTEAYNGDSVPQEKQSQELVDMQGNSKTQSEEKGAEDKAAFSQTTENLREAGATDLSSAAGTEAVSQKSDAAGNEGASSGNGSASSYENLPSGVPYTSGFSSSHGVASIVAPGEGDEESRVLYDNGDGTYSDYYGFQYSYQGDGNWADGNGNSYRTWNDEDYNFGTQLDSRELQGASGAVSIKETTNGDYYYCDANGVGYTDNGDGTWTDENGNTYSE